MGSALSIRARSLLNTCSEIGQRLLPQQCLLCTAPAGARLLCGACHRELPWLTSARCPQCALPTPHGAVCGECLREPPHFDGVAAAFVYTWPLAALIQHYKYAGNLALARLLAQAVGESLQTRVDPAVGGAPEANPGPATGAMQSYARDQPGRRADVIIPLPLSPQRLRSRGFNQALEIARLLGKSTGVPVAAHACRRVRDTTPQAALPWKERARNIRGAFVCDADLTGLRVAIVDDVMTTGATLNEIARNVRKAGAAQVYGWVAARTLKHE